MVKHKESGVDFIVLGGGIAGMRAAIELARGGRVLVLTKDDLYESSTEYAQGGIAAALSEDDEVTLHLHDTLLAGDGLCREEAVRVLVEEGPQQIHQLIEWGMRFDRNGTKLAFTREGAHSRSRILHAHGDSTGSEILRALMAKARTIHSIQLLPHTFATELTVEDGKVSGVNYIDAKTGESTRLPARSVLLATGGLGHAYKETTNPSVACGDGMAMAYRAGAILSDMEFVQFHPTALFVKGAPRFLLSEALRGEGAYLRNLLLERFMPHYHEAAELAPRDVVARAIIMEMHKTRAEFVYLDLTSLNPEHVKKRFPRIYSTCLQYNIDISTDLVPIRPAAHYSMGGVATDLLGATSLPGLFAAGEVASTGVHGANRLASNSLLEALVFSHRCYLDSVQKVDHIAFQQDIPDWNAEGTTEPDEMILITQSLKELQLLMSDYVGIVRTHTRLQRASKRLDLLHEEIESLYQATAVSPQLCEVRNLITVGYLIVKEAQFRKESRGLHYNTDYPQKSIILQNIVL